MPFQANVLKIMIASPSDVAAERTAIETEIHRWNYTHSVVRAVMLQPVRWETQGAPRMGAPAQDILNEDLLADSDILIGIFGTKIGTPTKDFVSGTVEEIKRHVAAGKLAMVYFSKIPVDPTKIDQAQWAALQEFKQECQTEGLYAEFDSLVDLTKKFGDHLALQLNSARFRWLTPSPVEPAYSSKEIVLTDAEERLVTTASEAEGQIFVYSTLDGYHVVAGGINFAGDSTRTFAACKRSLQRLLKANYLSQESDELYQLTDEGFSKADLLAASRPLELRVESSGTPDHPALTIQADLPISLQSVDFATSTGATTASQDFHPEPRTDFRIGLDHTKLVVLFNAPRADRNNYDFSGPAMIILRFLWRGRNREVALPVVLQQQFLNSTAWVTITGSRSFSLREN